MCDYNKNKYDFSYHTRNNKYLINKDIKKKILKKGNEFENILENDKILINFIAYLIDDTGEYIFYNTYKKNHMLLL